LFGRGHAGGGAVCPYACVCRFPTLVRCAQFGHGQAGGRGTCSWAPSPLCRSHWPSLAAESLLCLLTGRAEHQVRRTKAPTMPMPVAAVIAWWWRRGVATAMRGGYDGFLMKVFLGLLSVLTTMAPVCVMFLLGGVVEVPSAIMLCSLPLAPLLGEASPGGQSLPMFRRVSSSGASASSALSFMVPEYQMPDGISTTAAIPLQGSPHGRRWMVVRGPGCARGCHHLFQERSSCPMILGLRVRHHSLMVPEYQMPGGASTAAAIPLLDGGTWARMC
jgi:hypothetical protein